MGCAQSFENCFCVSMGANRSADYDMSIDAQGDGSYHYSENGRAGERRRVWASCMVDGFTDVAGGTGLSPVRGVVECFAEHANERGGMALICGFKTPDDLLFAEDIGRWCAKMCCGLGKCGHCKIGDKYVCLDGPVFNYAEGKRLVDCGEASAWRSIAN